MRPRRKTNPNMVRASGQTGSGHVEKSRAGWHHPQSSCNGRLREKPKNSNGGIASMSRSSRGRGHRDIRNGLVVGAFRRACDGARLKMLDGDAPENSKQGGAGLQPVQPARAKGWCGAPRTDFYKIIGGGSGKGCVASRGRQNPQQERPDVCQTTVYPIVPKANQTVALNVPQNGVGLSCRFRGG